jgi:hypothetical protein
MQRRLPLHQCSCTKRPEDGLDGRAHVDAAVRALSMAMRLLAFSYASSPNMPPPGL